MASSICFWSRYAPHPWQNWSILGSGLIVFVTNFSVQVSVALNDWRGFFYDMVQRALTTPGSVTPGEIYLGVGQFLSLALVGITVAVLNLFFVRHYIFRWRTAMNDYFTTYWQRLRHLEGASQRVQDDTMRFSSTMQGLGVSFIDSIMTLIAFLPLLAALSRHVTEIPIVGAIPYPLVIVAIVWSLFGTVLLAVVGIKLPGLEFKNQRVEAAFRKELVYGEDDATRAQPPTLRELFSNVRKNYFTLYAHYVYFDVVRYLYIQADAVFATLILVPTLAVGKITFGVFQQIVSAFTPGRDIVPVSRQLVADDRRTDLHLQAPARFRGDAGGRAAAGDRPALSGAGTRGHSSGGPAGGLMSRARQPPAARGSASAGAAVRFR